MVSLRSRLLNLNWSTVDSVVRAADTCFVACPDSRKHLHKYEFGVIRQHDINAGLSTHDELSEFITCCNNHDILSDIVTYLHLIADEMRHFTWFELDLTLRLWSSGFRGLNMFVNMFLYHPGIVTLDDVKQQNPAFLVEVVMIIQHLQDIFPFTIIHNSNTHNSNTHNSHTHNSHTHNSHTHNSHTHNSHTHNSHTHNSHTHNSHDLNMQHDTCHDDNTHQLTELCETNTTCEKHVFVSRPGCELECGLKYESLSYCIKQLDDEVAVNMFKKQYIEEHASDAITVINEYLQDIHDPETFLQQLHEEFPDTPQWLELVETLYYSDKYKK